MPLFQTLFFYDGVGELLVLDIKGFRLSCASLNLIWNLDVLDDVIETHDKCSRIIRRLRRRLESNLFFAFCVVIIITEAIFSRIHSGWVAVFLILEYVARVLCYIILSTHNFREFLAARWNSLDTVSAITDVAFLYFLWISGPNRAYKLLALSKVETMLPIASPTDFIKLVARGFRMLRLYRIVAWFLQSAAFFPTLVLKMGRDKWMRLCNRSCNFFSHPPETNSAPCPIRKGQIAVDLDSFRRYVTSMKMLKKSHIWPTSRYLFAFREMDTFDGTSIAITELSRLFTCPVAFGVILPHLLTKFMCSYL